MRMHDEIRLEGVRLTGDGYLVASPRVARAGIQLCSGAECGRPEMRTVRVYRSPEEVFDSTAMHSFAHKPVTVDHPSEKVDAKSWRRHAVGSLGGSVVRDGDAVKVDLVLMDATAIQQVQDGKRQLSMGYDCALMFQDGRTPDGEAFDAVQTRIRGNHLAVVDAARGGSSLRVGDSKMMHAAADAMTRDAMLLDIARQPLTPHTPPVCGALFQDAERAYQDYKTSLQDAWRKGRPDYVADARHTSRLTHQYDPQGRLKSTYEHEVSPDDPDGDEDGNARDARATDAETAYRTYCSNLRISMAPRPPMKAPQKLDAEPSPSLEQRIAAALNDGSADELGNLISETGLAITTADQAAQEARDKALDPALSPDPQAARAAMEDAQFVADRLRTLLPRLQESHKQCLAQETLARWRARAAELETDCGALAQVFASVYPRIIAELVPMLAQMQALENEIKTFNNTAPSGVPHLEGPELAARGLASPLMQPHIRVLDNIKLPHFNRQPDGALLAWAPASERPLFSPADVEKLSRAARSGAGLAAFLDRDRDRQQAAESEALTKSYSERARRDGMARP